MTVPAWLNRIQVVLRNFSQRRGIHCILALLMLWIVWQPVDQYRRGWIANEYVAGDAVLYFAWVHSVVEDGDIQFADEYAELDPNLHPNLKQQLPNGYTGNIFPAGPAVLWSPFYLTAKVVIATNGIEERSEQLDLLLLSANIGTAAYTALFALLLYRILRRLCNRWQALLIAVAILFATPLTYYLREERIYSHNLGAFAIALFIWLVIRREPADRSWLHWLLIGGSVGLIASIRLQDVLVILWLAVEQVPVVYNQLKQRDSLLVLGRNYLLAAAGALSALLPTLIGMWTLYGLGNTPVASGANTLWLEKPHLFELLFSSRHGLFSWHPLLILGCIGLLILPWKSKNRIGFPALLLLLTALYFTAAIGDWHGGSAFGQRRLISYLPLFALGFAAVCKSGKRWWGWSLAVLLVLGMLWNQTLLDRVITSHGYINAGPHMSNPLNPDRTLKVNQWGAPLISPWMDLAAMPLGIPARDLDWILSYELDTRQHNLGGIISARYPAFQHGFSLPLEQDGKTVRELEHEGTIYLTLGHRQPPRYAIAVNGLLQSESKLSDDAAILISINDAAHSLLISSGTENPATWTAHRLPLEQNPWHHGLNTIRLQLVRLDSKLAIADTPASQLFQQVRTMDNADVTARIESLSFDPRSTAESGETIKKSDR